MASAGLPDKTHWVKDEFVLKCSACRQPFSVSVRRHHCRKCGEVFCANCSSKSAPLPSLGYRSKQRVCEQCYASVCIEASVKSDGGSGQGGVAAFGQRSQRSKTNVKQVEDELTEGLKRLYRAGIKPLETQFRFGEFYSPLLTDADFDAKPLVLLLGQYSVGKTTFIQNLVGRDFPGCRIGPEPTTDRFLIVSDSRSGSDQLIPGNALAVQSDRPFRSLQRFGAAFLNKVSGSDVSTTAKGGMASVLRSISFVDTPGVLSGEKQRIGRSYDFPAVVEWFAGRCDRILLLFDAHKLDISDEFREVIGALRGQDNKIRIVLNKADGVDAQSLLRVHGSLMWSLGKVIQTPEVCRVYVGSFWDRPVRNKEFESLFARERDDLIEDLHSLPATALVRKVNEVVKRARAARVHAVIIEHIRSQLPSYFGRAAAMEKLMGSLEQEFRSISVKHSIPHVFRRLMKVHCNDDVSGFPALNPKMLAELDEVLSTYVPKLLSKHNREAKREESADNPFSGGDDMNEGSSAGCEWAIGAEEYAEAAAEFAKLKPGGSRGRSRSRLTGEELRNVLLDTKLPKATLRHLWDLADVDNDGALDVAEFAVAKRLIHMAQSGEKLPDLLMPDMVPPSKRGDNAG